MLGITQLRRGLSGIRAVCLGYALLRFQAAPGTLCHMPVRAKAMSLPLHDGTGDLLEQVKNATGVRASREVIRLALTFTLRWWAMPPALERGEPGRTG